MFKNSVFNVSVDTKKWVRGAAVRAVKTFAQTAGSMITVGLALNEIDWPYLASVAAVAGIYSIVTSIAGIPEVEAKVE